MTKNYKLSFQTKKQNDFVDITGDLAKMVEESGVNCGIINIQTLHTIARVFENENEPGLIEDFKKHLEKFSPEKQYYQHDDFNIRTVNMCSGECANGHAHIKSIFMPTSVTANIINGKLSLGTWQRIFLWEFDRARKREVEIVIIGE